MNKFPSGRIQSIQTTPIRSRPNITQAILIDTKRSIEIKYNPNIVPQNTKIPELMQKIQKNSASIEEKKEFGILWQQRVQEIFNNKDKVITIL